MLLSEMADLKLADIKPHQTLRPYRTNRAGDNLMKHLLVENPNILR